MTSWDDDRDPVLGALSRLATHEPDAARAARALTRGRAMLAARTGRRPLTVRVAPRGGWGPAVESLVVAGASAVFLLEVLSRATWLYRF